MGEARIAKAGGTFQKIQFLLVDTDYTGGKKSFIINCTYPPSISGYPSPVRPAAAWRIWRTNREDIAEVVYKPIFPPSCWTSSPAPKRMPMRARRKYRSRRTIERPRFNGVSVLLVEDNLVNQKLMGTLFSNIGCTMDLAANGVEAIVKTQSISTTSFLWIVRCRRSNGFQATRQIRCQ